MTDVGRGALAGAVGGALGSTAMVLFNSALGRAGYAPDDVGRHHQRHHLTAKPNDSDGTIADEPATRKAASHVSELVTGEPLDEETKTAGGLIFHHAFGAVVGAIYGAAAVRFPTLTAGAGIPFGAAVWMTAAEAGMPMMGLARAPHTYPPERHVASLLSHLVYGLTLECVRKAGVGPRRT
jgi:hypothetical protein